MNFFAINLRRWLQPMKSGADRRGPVRADLFWQGPSCWAGTRV